MGKAEALRSPLGRAWLARRALGNTLLKAVFAPPCAACGLPLESPIDGCVCAACWAAIEPPPYVELPPGALSVAAAAGDYAGTLRDIIHAFKYDGRRSLAGPLADRMRERGASVLHGADAVVPVPLHPWRRMRRGFNQATELASALGLPAVHALWRVRMTKAQANLTAAQRRRNVAQAFRISPLCAAGRLQGAVVVLVDDVRTTGATLHACADVLLKGGAKEVRALTAAVRV